ncbi:hypothetical protein PPSIR1_29513 [Plesiocystis pacifica SIR-1]|uniref:Uncharacterized protein n=1 Tax=Plesiocystis pacifica SIR-1 TaxID=391625 RepID=A6G670_9BACT|nr:hypothetical protein [Plesiocystis pacifica]EDM78672.1 hypothetical protein PPSIR1_29513 [Plesiocystis pacifica SIR-1]
MTATAQTPLYPADLPLVDARKRYFEANGFDDEGGSEDGGGYDDETVRLIFLGRTLTVPNPKSRRDALVYHDLHHVLTGYGTDLPGEVEVGAWELATGCGRYKAAWVLNATIFAVGLWRWPRRARAAFIWGRSTANLYGRAIAPLLERRLAELREELAIEVDAGARARVVEGAGLGPRLAFWLAAVLVQLPVLAMLSMVGVALARALT